MAEQSRRDDRTPKGVQDAPNSASEMEQAEGSREIAESNEPRGAGITNRPLDAEQEEQQRLPPRGQSKDGSHA